MSTHRRHRHRSTSHRRRRSGTGKPSPNCAKIWDFIASLGGDYENYATNIVDICAKDYLADQTGLTVIIPDEAFRRAFHNHIHGDGRASEARRMLMNTVIRRYLDDPEAFASSDYKETLPLRSGLILPVTSVQHSSIILGDNIEIKKRDDFHSPRGFRYAIWEVVRGRYPVETTFEVHRKKKAGTRKSKVTGGGKDRYIVNVGRMLASSRETKRVGLISVILAEYKSYLVGKASLNDPILAKGVSLYNWLYMYDKPTYKKCLCITDVHPGINLLLLILDPNSLVTDRHLFGCDESSAMSERTGWHNTVISTNPNKEWKEHLERTTAWATPEKEMEYSDYVMRERHRMISRDPSTVRGRMTRFYADLPAVIQKYASGEHANALHEWFGPREYKYRKLWQDQFRMVALFGFSRLADVCFVAVDDADDILRDMVTFRPDGCHYDKAAQFSYEPGNYKSAENDYLVSKFFMTTDLGYMPSASTLSERKSLALLPASQSGYSAALDSALHTANVCNCHRIKYDIFMSMEYKSHLTPELLYGMKWHLDRSRAEGSDESADRVKEIDDLIQGFQMQPDRQHRNSDVFDRPIAANRDPYDIHGGTLATGRISKQSKTDRKIERIVRRGVKDSDRSDSDEVASLANFTFFIGSQEGSIIDDSDTAQLAPRKDKKEKRKKEHRRRYEESSDED